MNKRPLTMAEKNNRLFAVILFSIILSLPFWINPNSQNLLTCSFKEMSGYPCPTCGMSRSFYSLTHFNLSQALDYHLMGPVVYFSLMFLTFLFTVELLLQKKLILQLQRIHKLLFFTMFASAWIYTWFSHLLAV